MRFLSVLAVITVLVCGAAGTHAYAANNFVTIRLPHGIQIDLPKNWKALSENQMVTLDSSVQSRSDGEKIFDASSDLNFAANYYDDAGKVAALMNVRYYPDLDVSQAEAHNAGMADVLELDAILRDSIAKTGRVSGISVLVWSGTRKQVINGVAAFVTEYKRAPLNNNGNFIIRLVRVFNGEQSFTMTVSYREDQEYLMRPICDRIISSISPMLIAGRPQDASTALAPPVEAEPSVGREWAAARQQDTLSRHRGLQDRSSFVRPDGEGDLLEENLIDVMGLGAANGANLTRAHISPIARRFESVNLSDEMGMTLDYASVNRDDIIRRRALEEVNPQTIREQSPAFSEWAAKDEANAVIPYDSVPFMQKLEWKLSNAVNAAADLLMAYMRGIKGSGVLLSLVLVLSLVVTWGAGLAPPILVRYVILRRPLSRKSASWLAASFSAFFWIAFHMLNIWSGEKPGNGTVWIIMFFVARWIMTREGHSLPKNDRITERVNETQETKVVLP